MPAKPPEEIPEDRVLKILARAAELDGGPATVSLETLRAAAMEAGIRRAAIDQALEEYATAPGDPVQRIVVAEAPRPKGRVRRWLRKLAIPLQLTALAFALGIGAAAGDVMIPAALVAWIAVAVRLLLRLRRAGKTGTWQLTMTLMTFFMCFAYAAVGAGDEDVVAAMLITGVALFATGTALIHWSSREDALLDEHPSAT